MAITSSSRSRSQRRVSFTVAKFAEATKLALISINSSGDVEFVNPAACRLFGYTKDELIGKPITIIVPDRMRGAHTAGLRKVSEGAEA